MSPYISDKQGKTIKTNLIKTKHPKLTDNVVQYLIQNLPRDTFGFQTSLNIFHNSPAFGIQTARGLIPPKYDYQVLGLAYFLGNMSEVIEQVEAFERSGLKVDAILDSLLGTFRKLLRVTVARKRKYEDIAELLLNTSDKQFYRYCNNELKTPPTLRELAGRYAKLVTAKQHQNINYLF